MAKENKESGLLLKHSGIHGYENIRMRSLGLREASKDSEGYYIKADGENEDGNLDQIYLYLRGSDVVDVIQGWINSIRENGTDFEKWLLHDALQSSTPEEGSV